MKCYMDLLVLSYLVLLVESIKNIHWRNMLLMSIIIHRSVIVI